MLWLLGGLFCKRAKIERNVFVPKNDFMHSNKFLFITSLLFFIPFILIKGDEIPKGDTIKIGLLISDNKSSGARQGAELAITEANNKKGVNGSFFHLVIRSLEGLWGTGSKQAVNLIFDEKVTAILGSHDGRNAHLVEQASTKAHVIFLSAWSGDPTLSQAFVPWFFNCVPNDLQQADFLIKAIYGENKNAKIALVSDGSYDSESAMKYYLKVNKLAGKDDPIIAGFNPSENNMNGLIKRFNDEGVNTLVLAVQPATAKIFLKELEKRQLKQAVYCFLSVLGEEVSENYDKVRLDNILVPTSGTWYKKDESGFVNDYRLRYGKTPGAVAAYAYDGTKLIIEAIKSSGTERESIQKWLLNMKYTGATGSFRFDEKGNRVGNSVLVKIKDGILVEIKMKEFR